MGAGDGLDRRGQWGKNWDNCNRINKNKNIYPKKKGKVLPSKPRKEGRKFTEREAEIYPLTRFWPALSLSLSPLSLNDFLFFFFEGNFNLKGNGVLVLEVFLGEKRNVP